MIVNENACNRPYKNKINFQTKSYLICYFWINKLLHFNHLSSDGCSAGLTLVNVAQNTAYSAWNNKVL